MVGWYLSDASDEAESAHWHIFFWKGGKNLEFLKFDEKAGVFFLVLLSSERKVLKKPELDLEEGYWQPQAMDRGEQRRHLTRVQDESHICHVYDSIISRFSVLDSYLCL